MRNLMMMMMMMMWMMMVMLHQPWRQQPSANGEARAWTRAHRRG
jgi:hypothetical protein